MSDLTPSFWMRIGVEYYELKTNYEIQQFIEWDEELYDDDSYDCDAIPTLCGKITIKNTEYDISVTWNETLFKPPVINITGYNDQISKYEEQWSPVLKAHQWLLMIIMELINKI